MKPYPAYKDSGVEWLGQVPEGWEVVSLRHLVTCLDGKRVPLNSEQRSHFQGEVPYWGANGVLDHVNGLLFDEPLVLLGEDGAPFFDKSKGVAFFSEGPVWPNNHIHVLRPMSRTDGEYLTYSLNATDYAHFIDGSTREKLTQSRMMAIPIAWPPLEQRVSIAAFLDRETAKIDGLIEEQRRLIALLAEKRQATISHAVTRGLNPSARLKPSGVDWLGDIPEGWEVRRLKYFVSEIKAGPFGSALTKDMYSDSGYRVYGQEQVIPADFTVGDYYIPGNTFKILANYAVEPGDVLISCVGTFGRIAVVPKDIEPGIINPRLMRLRCKEEIIPEYLATVLKSPVVSRQFEFLSRGGTMDVINVGTLQEIWIAAPLIDLQREILDMLAKITAQLDALTETATSAIALLQERRAALVSAAVTGKIDVRDLALVSEAA